LWISHTQSTSSCGCRSIGIHADKKKPSFIVNPESETINKMEVFSCDREIILSDFHRSHSHSNSATFSTQRKFSSKVINNFTNPTKNRLHTSACEIQNRSRMCDKVACDKGKRDEIVSSSSKAIPQCFSASSKYYSVPESLERSFCKFDPSKVSRKVRRVPLINFFLLGNLLFLRYGLFY